MLRKSNGRKNFLIYEEREVCPSLFPLFMRQEVLLEFTAALIHLEMLPPFPLSGSQWI